MRDTLLESFPVTKPLGNAFTYIIGDFMQCSSCSRDINTETDLKRGICFVCHIKGIGFTFKGVAYGRDAWNTSTIRETQRMYESMPGIEKVPQRAELI